MPSSAPRAPVSAPTSFTDLIDRWETIAAFARDVEEPYENAKAWQRNDSIPARAFNTIIAAAKAEGIPGVTHELLCSFAEAKHQERRAEAS